MDIPDIHAFDVIFVDTVADAFLHASCGTIGEGETQHIAVSHAVLVVGVAYALGEDMRLATSGRCKNQVASLLGGYDDILR